MAEDEAFLCVGCGGSTVPVLRPHTVDRAGKLVVVRDVPMHECGECGETYMTAAVMKQLDEVVSLLLSGTADEAIAHYPAA